MEVGDERPSAKLDNNTNLLDFSLWIAVRLSTMAPSGGREQRRVYSMYRSIARKIKKTSHINLATENMQISGLRRRRV